MREYLLKCENLTFMILFGTFFPSAPAENGTFHKQQRNFLFSYQAQKRPDLAPEKKKHCHTVRFRFRKIKHQIRKSQRKRMNQGIRYASSSLFQKFFGIKEGGKRKVKNHPQNKNRNMIFQIDRNQL